MRFLSELINVVILAGGRSSRLFPFNKVLSDLTGSGRSLIQQARDRLSMMRGDQIFVLTIKDMVKPIRRQLGIPVSRVFVDPVSRGTWPALLWAMAHLRQKEDAVMAVVTGDHVIPKVREFQKAFRQGVQIAQKESAFVVIPVKPTAQPENWTGFGAIKAEGGRIIGFEEKPSLKRAQQMITEGEWFWNAGMFFFRISVAEQVLRANHEGIYEIYLKIVHALSRGKTSAAKKLFEQFPSKIAHPFDRTRMVDNTIDYAVMMPLVHRSLGVGGWMTSQALTQWTDLGQWTALRQVVKADRSGNIRIGDVQVDRSVRNSILVAERGHRLEVSGIEGMIVAFAGGKALVLSEAEVGRVKELVAASGDKSRLIGDKRYIASFALSKRRNVSILSNRGKESI